MRGETWNQRDKTSHHSNGARNKMATTLENANPTIFQQKQERSVLPEEEDEDVVDKIDEREVFDILFKKFFLCYSLKKAKLVCLYGTGSKWIWSKNWCNISRTVPFKQKSIRFRYNPVQRRHS